MLAWAGEQGRETELQLALFDAYFGEAKNPSDPKVLREKAEEVGLDGRYLISRAQSPETLADAIRQVASEAAGQSSETARDSKHRQRIATRNNEAVGAGLSQRQFAEQFGFEHRSIQNGEHKRRNPAAWHAPACSSSATIPKPYAGAFAPLPDPHHPRR